LGLGGLFGLDGARVVLNPLLAVEAGLFGDVETRPIFATFTPPAGNALVFVVFTLAGLGDKFFKEFTLFLAETKRGSFLFLSLSWGIGGTFFTTFFLPVVWATSLEGVSILRFIDCFRLIYST
jgi:hypothetical protein